MADEPKAVNARVRVLEGEVKIPRSNLKAKDRGYVAQQALGVFQSFGTALMTPGIAAATVQENKTHIVYKWRVGVMVDDSIEPFSRQLEEARQAGIREAWQVVGDIVASHTTSPEELVEHLAELAKSP